MLLHYYSQPAQAIELSPGLTWALAALLCGDLSKVLDLMTHSGVVCLMADASVQCSEQTAFTFT